MADNLSFDAVVAGGGPAGLMCAVSAAERGLTVALLERLAPALPKKLLITGKGRCNVVNASAGDEFFDNILRGSRFLMSSVTSFNSFDIMDWFENHGVPLKTERGNRVFPVSDRAADIASALVKAANDTGVEIIPGRVSRILTENDRVTGVETHDGRIVNCRAAVIATGGKSYPKTGSDGDGYEMAKALGHTVSTLYPSLVPLECRGGDCAGMMGLSLKNVTLRFPAEGKDEFFEMGEMLFTHFGISGPLTLSLSALIVGKDIDGLEVSIDLKPALTAETLDRRILRDFSENLNREFKNSLGALLPKSMIPVIIKRSGVDPDKKINSVTSAERAALVKTLKDFRLVLSRARGVDEAVVTAGGVELKEINPKTMMSKKIKELYFAGEVLNADGVTGGFNLGIAFATGRAAGTHMLSEG